MIRNFIIASLMVALPFAARAEEKTVPDVATGSSVDTEQVVRIADIEVYPEYLDDFLKAAKEIASTSIREEAGVVCLFPSQLKEDSRRFRVVEIYASQAAYQHHIQTKHFQRYKQKTMKMVKKLKLNDINPLDVNDMARIFARIKDKSEHMRMELTNRQQAFITLAAMEAKGDIDGLKAALNDGFDKDLTISEAKEAFSHLYAYTGFPRSLNALNALQQVIKEREEKGLKTEKGVEADPLPADYDALKTGTAVQTQLTGGKPFDYSFAPQTDYYLKAHLFGDIFSRNNLSFADRELITIGAISALPGCEAQLLAHVSGARNMGVNDEELRAIPSVLRLKVGDAESGRVKTALGNVLNEPVKDVETVDFSVWPKGEPNTAYAQYFIGNSYLADMNSRYGGPHNVTFEPRCRNNWHVHHKSVQVLVCVAGRGWYQEWGKPAVALRPGMVITVPEGVKHWHGAAHDSWFQHLAYTTNVGKGAGNEWLEPVTDEIYNQLK